MLKRRNAIIAILSAFFSVAYFAPALHAQAKADATGTWKWTQAGRGGRGGPGGGGGGAGRGGPATQPGAGAPATQPAAAAGAPGAARGPGGGAPGGGGGRGGGAPIEVTATLKQDGEKLTGSVVGLMFGDPTAKNDISEGSVKPDGTVAFKVAIDNGQFQVTRTFTGKLDGDKITGTGALEFPGGAPGGPGGPGGGAPGAGGPPAGGPGGAPGAGAPGGGGRGGGFGGPQPWEATRQK